uniref:Chemokine interleukin-8-like domain-containing protein n=1 Tax=Chelydra serpentina TaxID=8475 RepID=A0A8C3XSE1_CHESE
TAAAALPPAPWADSLAPLALVAAALPSGQICSVGAPMADELRCQCQQTATRVIPPKHIAHVELIPEGLHCLVPEVIATMKNGKKVCLEPTAPWVKLIVKKILSSWDEQGTTCFDYS